jgi:hypothetical protein
MIGTHGRAMNLAIKAGKGTLTDAHAPLLALCKELATQMDAADGDPSTRLTAAYLSALKDLARALAVKQAAAPVQGKLAQLRALRTA